jgi:hypothetical protein
VAQDVGKLHVRSCTSRRSPTEAGARHVAKALHDFLAAATTSLDIALYDFARARARGAGSGHDRRGAGRRGRLPFGSTTTPTFRAPIPVPPPPELAPEDVERLSVPTKAIAGIPT